MSRLLELCRCTETQICPFCIQLTVVIIAMIIGILLIWQPKRAIDIQIAFYRLINWKIEPISMEKEIRNTRIMGLAVVILGIIVLICIVTL